MTTQNATAVGGNRGREKALSSFDVPHNVAISVGYELPIGQGRRFLGNANAVVDGLLGGWQVQGIYIWRSGRPFTPTISVDRANTGVANQRPNRLGSGQLDEPTVEVWFDKTAFALPAQFTFGNAGRNILRGPKFISTDLSLMKNFVLHGNTRFQVRVEMYNVFNNVNYNNPNSSFDAAGFGRITGAGSMRQIQLGGKLIF
jgi:hypothetical protein